MVVLSLIYRLVSRGVDLVRIHRMTEAEKDIEILVLRHQLARRQVKSSAEGATARVTEGSAQRRLERLLASHLAPALPE